MFFFFFFDSTTLLRAVYLYIRFLTRHQYYHFYITLYTKRNRLLLLTKSTLSNCNTAPTCLCRVQLHFNLLCPLLLDPVQLDGIHLFLCRSRGRRLNCSSQWIVFFSSKTFMAYIHWCIIICPLMKLITGLPCPPFPAVHHYHTPPFVVRA